MILVFAVAIGLAAGFVRARLKGAPYQTIELKHLWLVLIAAVPQVLAFFLPATRERIPDQWIPTLLISTQLILLVFIWVNRKAPFIWLLGFGLLLNFVVISLNGGWMPISLSDILTLPKWLPYRVAFSIGDVLISIGIIGYLVQVDQSEQREEVQIQENKRS